MVASSFVSCCVLVVSLTLYFRSWLSSATCLHHAPQIIFVFSVFPFAVPCISFCLHISSASCPFHLYRVLVLPLTSGTLCCNKNLRSRILSISSLTARPGFCLHGGDYGRLPASCLPPHHQDVRHNDLAATGVHDGRRRFPCLSRGEDALVERSLPFSTGGHRRGPRLLLHWRGTFLFIQVQTEVHRRHLFLGGRGMCLTSLARVAFCCQSRYPFLGGLLLSFGVCPTGHPYFLFLWEYFEMFPRVIRFAPRVLVWAYFI